MISVGYKADILQQVPWELPHGWEWIKLGRMCEIQIGGSPRTKVPEYWGQGYTWVSIADLNNEIVTTSKKEITDSGVANSNVKLIEPGTILMSFKLTIGKLGIAGKQLYTNEAIAALPVKTDWEDRLSVSYLFNSLKAIPLTADVDRAAKGKTLNKKKVAELLIPIPYPSDPQKSLDIQKRIVARLEALLQEVRESRKICDRMCRDANRLLEVAVNEVFNRLDSVIETVPFQEIGTAFNGRASGSGESNVRVFKTRHTYPHKLRLGDPSYAKSEQAPKLPKERFLRPGDTLMANIAEGTLGRVSYVHECEGNWTVDTQIMILRSKDEKEVLGKWIYYYFWSERGQREILSRRTGIAFADKRGQTHIYPRDIQPIPFPKMHINAQRQAVAYLDTVLNESEKMTELVQQDMKTLDLLEQSILDRAFRGEL